MSAVMAAFLLSKEFRNADYLNKVSVCSLCACFGVLFLPIYIILFFMWLSVYALIKTPAEKNLFRDKIPDFGRNREGMEMSI